MIKKIFLFLLFFLIVFHLSSKLTLACYLNGTWTDAAELCCTGCVDGDYCHACASSCEISSCSSIGYECTSDTQYYCNGSCWVLNKTCSCGCDGDTCKSPCPTAVPPTSAVPTAVPCDNDGNGVCNTFNPSCTYVCETTCSVGQIYKEKTVYCRTNGSCLFCSTEYNVSAPIQCGLCSNTTPVPPGCQPYLCYNAPDATHCPSFNPGANCGFAGNCDNCGGLDCGWCGGVPPGGGTTPAPGCIENCFTDTRYPTTCYNATFGICSGTVSCWGGKPNDCACAATTCVGSTCDGTCGDDCAGTKVNACPCAANTCVGSTCGGTCGGICPGTKVDESQTNCTGTQVQYTETPQTTGTIWAKATGCTSGVTSVTFPTWNSYNNQDDIGWYSGTNQGGGIWQSTINISSHQPTLGSTLNVHVYENGVCRPVGSGWEWVGAQTVTLAPKTCAVTINTSGAVSSQTNGINITTTGNAHINPGGDTVRSFISKEGNPAIVGGITYDYGGSMGISALLDGNNYYNLVNTNLVSTNSNTTTSSYVVHAPPGTYRVHCDVPSDLDGNLVKCSGNPNCAFNNNGVGSICSGWKSCSSNDWATFRINSPPVINSITITNNVGTTLVVESGNQNHICQSTIRNSTAPRTVRFLVNASDPNGGSEINSINLTWHGRTYVTTLGTANGNNRTGIVDVTFSAADNDGGVWGVGATVVDIYGSNGQLTPRSFKVWNCQVQVNGSLYEAKDGSPLCSTTSVGSFIEENKVGLGVSFDSLLFSDSPDVNMTNIARPADYSSTNNIIWGKTYHPRINGGTTGNEDGNLLAAGRVTRITDLGAGAAAQCPSSQFTIGSGPNALISAYSTSPTAQIDFSFIRDQEAWYQVAGAGVKSAGPLSYGVPVTAPNEALTIFGTSTENGLVSATDFTNINGYDGLFGYPTLRNWYLEQSTNDSDIYNYKNYFYDNFYVKAGVGETKTNSWDGWATDKIYFVSESLNIDDNLTVPSGETMMVIVSGDIAIDPSVTQLDGIYIANGSISAGGSNDTQLVINGMLYARNTIRLNRSFTNKRTNNTTPAVKVNYSPGLIFNLDPRVLRVLSGWREE